MNIKRLETFQLCISSDYKLLKTTKISDSTKNVIICTLIISNSTKKINLRSGFNSIVVAWILKHVLDEVNLYSGAENDNGALEDGPVVNVVKVSPN